jgi:hypothetical protein
MDQGPLEGGFLIKAALIAVALYFVGLPLFRNFPWAR